MTVVGSGIALFTVQPISLTSSQNGRVLTAGDASERVLKIKNEKAMPDREQSSVMPAIVAILSPPSWICYTVRQAVQTSDEVKEIWIIGQKILNTAGWGKR